jgi:hypothetical protein
MMRLAQRIQLLEKKVTPEKPVKLVWLKPGQSISDTELGTSRTNSLIVTVRWMTSGDETVLPNLVDRP